MESQEFSRRTFLRGLGAASAFSLFGVAPFLPKGSIHQIRSIPNFKAGVILPNKVLAAGLSTRFMRGLSLGGGLDQQSTTMSYHPLVTADSFRSTFLAALDNQALDMIVAFTGSYSMSMLADLVDDDNQRPILMVNPGGNFNSVRSSKNIHFHSLSQAALNFGGAQQAVKAFGPRGVVLSSFYDSGFDTVFAAENGIKAADGIPLGSWITDAPYDAVGAAYFIDQLVKISPDFVYSLHSGSQGAEFYQAWTAHSASHTIPLVTNEFASEQHTSNLSLGARVLNFSAADDQSDQGKNFVQQYQGQYGEPADSIALLGYEARLFIEAALQKIGNNDYATLKQAFLEAQIESPRGKLGLNTNDTFATVWKPLQSPSTSLPHLQPNQLRQIESATVFKTGWLFPYLAQ